MRYSEGIVSEKFVAALLGVTVKTLRNQRALGKGPPAIKADVGRVAIYHRWDLDDYLHAARVELAMKQTGNDNRFVPQIVQSVPAMAKRPPGRPKGSFTKNRRAVAA